MWPLYIIFIILVGLQKRARIYILQGAYLNSAILLVSMIPLFILMVLKEKNMKERGE